MFMLRCTASADGCGCVRFCEELGAGQPAARRTVREGFCEASLGEVFCIALCGYDASIPRLIKLRD